MEADRTDGERLVRSGDRLVTLREALAENAESLKRFLWRLSGDEETARDLAQDAMVKAILKSASFRGESSFRTWLFAIAANLLRDHRRKKRPLPLPPDEVLHDGGEGAARTEEELDAERAWRLLAKLPEPKRAALTLRLEFGHSYEEIAAILSCPVGTVKSRIHSGIEELKEAMGVDDGN